MGATVRQLAESVLAAQWERVGLERPRLYPGDREQLARRLHDIASLPPFVNPRHFARALGFLPTSGSVGGCGGEVTDGRLVLYREDMDWRETALLVWHGTAHAGLDLNGEPYTEADAWWTTGEIALPPVVFRTHTLEEILARAHLPEWFILKWAATARRRPPPLRPPARPLLHEEADS